MQLYGTAGAKAVKEITLPSGKLYKGDAGAKCREEIIVRTGAALHGQPASAATESERCVSPGSKAKGEESKASSGDVSRYVTTRSTTFYYALLHSCY